MPVLWVTESQMVMTTQQWERGTGDGEGNAYGCRLLSVWTEASNSGP